MRRQLRLLPVCPNCSLKWPHCPLRRLQARLQHPRHGPISPLPTPRNGEPQWLRSPAAQQRCRLQRAPHRGVEHKRLQLRMHIGVPDMDTFIKTRIRTSTVAGSTPPSLLHKASPRPSALSRFANTMISHSLSLILSFLTNLLTGRFGASLDASTLHRPHHPFRADQRDRDRAFQGLRFP